MIVIDCLNPVCASYVEEKLVECFGTDGIDVRQTGHTLLITDTPTESVNVAIKWFAFGLRLAHSELSRDLHGVGEVGKFISQNSPSRG